jgi:hypothetical protein
MKSIFIHAAAFAVALSAFGVQAAEVAPGDLGNRIVEAGSAIVGASAPEPRYEIGIGEAGPLENPNYREAAGPARAPVTVSQPQDPVGA